MKSSVLSQPADADEGINKPAPTVQIVWIDDEIDLQSLYISSLVLSGYRVFATSSISEFLANIPRRDSAICIVDLRLSQVEKGEQLVEHLIDSFPNIYVLIYSNFVNSDSLRQVSSRVFKLKKFTEDAPISPNADTKLRRALASIALTANGHSNSSLIKNSTWLPATSWHNLRYLYAIALARMLSILGLAYVITKVAANINVPLRDLASASLGQSLLISAALLAISAATFRIRCPAEFLTTLDRFDFIAKYTSHYQTDATFRRHVNETLEKAQLEIQPKAYDAISMFQSEVDKSRPISRFIVAATFLAFSIRIGNAFLVDLVGGW